MSAKDYRLYLSHAVGSANEMQVHLLIAKELGYLDAAKADELHEAYDVVARQLNRLIRSWT